MFTRFLVAQEKEELNHRKQVAEQKTRRAQRNAPDTDIEDNQDIAENVIDDDMVCLVCS